MLSRSLLVSLSLALWIAVRPVAAVVPCYGDCDGDGRVTVDEIILQVQVALIGGLDCPAADVNGDGQLAVDEILVAVNSALIGCEIDAVPLAALVDSDPVSGQQQVPTFEWLRLEFAADVDPGSRAGFSLRCGGVHRPAGVYLIDSRTVVINPARDLPADSICTLAWPGADGPAALEFSTASVSDGGTVVYDRSNRRVTTPFPDDYWLAEDPSKPNGVRLAIALPEGPTDLRGLHRVLLRDTLALDGFSPIGHFTIELTQAPDPTSLPRTPAESLDPTASIGLFDITAGSATWGQRVPFRIDVRDDLNITGIRSHSLLIFPSIPLEPGGQYGLIVTRRMRISNDRPFEPSTFFAAALGEDLIGQDPSVAKVRALASEVIERVRSAAGQPLQADDVSLAVRATIRTTDDIPNDLLAVRAQVDAAPPPEFTITDVRPDSNPNVAAIVTGTWQAPDWRDGLFFRRDQNGLPVQTKINSVPFILALPKKALDGPVPITMYQHGNPGSAEREVAGEARDYLAEAGFAVIGFTDNLNREVSAGSGGSVEAITKQITAIFFGLLQNQHIPDFWAELNAEQIAFVRMLGSMGTLDVLPIGAPDGVPDLDPNQPLTYVGISQGANYAPGLLPYTPEIRSAAVVAGGARLTEVLIHQQPEAFTNQLGSFYPSMTASDIWMALSLFQTIYDRQDEHNHARFLYREPLAIGDDPHRASVLLLEGLDDSLVPNHATDSLAWALGPIPHLLPVQRPVPFLETVMGPVIGNIDPFTTAAYYQYVPVGVEGIDPTPGCAALNQTEGHYCAQSAEESERQRTIFFQTTLTDPAPTIIDPLAE